MKIHEEKSCPQCLSQWISFHVSLLQLSVYYSIHALSRGVISNNVDRGNVLSVFPFPMPGKVNVVAVVLIRQ